MTDATKTIKGQAAGMKISSADRMWSTFYGSSTKRVNEVLGATRRSIQRSRKEGDLEELETQRKFLALHHRLAQLKGYTYDPETRQYE